MVLLRSTIAVYVLVHVQMCRTFKLFKDLDTGIADDESFKPDFLKIDLNPLTLKVPFIDFRPTDLVITYPVFSLNDSDRDEENSSFGSVGSTRNRFINVGQPFKNTDELNASYEEQLFLYDNTDSEERNSLSVDSALLFRVPEENVNSNNLMERYKHGDDSSEEENVSEEDSFETSEEDKQHYFIKEEPVNSYNEDTVPEDIIYEEPVRVELSEISPEGYITKFRSKTSASASPDVVHEELLKDSRANVKQTDVKDESDFHSTPEGVQIKDIHRDHLGMKNQDTLTGESPSESEIYGELDLEKNSRNPSIKRFKKEDIIEHSLNDNQDLNIEDEGFIPVLTQSGNSEALVEFNKEILSRQETAPEGSGSEPIREENMII